MRTAKHGGRGRDGVCAAAKTRQAASLREIIVCFRLDRLKCLPVPPIFFTPLPKNSFAPLAPPSAPRDDSRSRSPVARLQKLSIPCSPQTTPTSSGTASFCFLPTTATSPPLPPPPILAPQIILRHQRL